MNNAIQDSNISEKDYAFSNGEVNSYQKLKGKIRKKDWNIFTTCSKK